MNLVFLFTAAILSALTIHRLLLQPQMEGQPDVEAGRYRLLLLLAALLAVAVRVYRFGGVPGGFNQDGAMAAIDAKALADYGTDHYGMRWPVHLTAWGYGQMSVLLSYLMAPCIKLFRFNVVSLRLPQLLVSLLGLLALYLFCGRLLARDRRWRFYSLRPLIPGTSCRAAGPWTATCTLISFCSAYTFSTRH